MKKAMYQNSIINRSQRKGCIRRTQDELEKQKGLIKITEVGMYWAAIKGRWANDSSEGSRSGAQRRIYLAVKYGNRWLNKIKIKQSL